MRYVSCARALLVGLVLFTPAAYAAGTGCTGGCEGDFDGDGSVTINELVTAVNHALEGCPTAAVVLKTPETDGASVVLSWDPVDQPGFGSYRIYRAEGQGGDFQIVGVLTDPTASTFRDTSVNFGTYLYYVGLLRTGGRESRSNTQQVTAGVFVEVNGQVEVMLADPTRPYLYALDRVNNSLHFINLQTREIEKTIFVGSIPTDMDLDATGSELFIANFGSTEIAVVDLARQEKSRSLFVDTGGIWDGNPYRLACGPQGSLVFTSEDQWNDLTLIDTENGATIDNQDSVYQPDLVASPDRSRIYVGPSGISSSAPLRFDIVGDTIRQTDSGVEGGFSSRIIIMSGDGKYVFYAGRKVLANNLKAVLGTFSENIYASNSDGSIAIGDGHIFNGNTFGIIRPSPVQTQTLAVSPDDQTVYFYDTRTSRIYFFSLASL